MEVFSYQTLYQTPLQLHAAVTTSLRDPIILSRYAPIPRLFKPRAASLSDIPHGHRQNTMLKVPDHQVAGHQAGDGKLGPLTDDSGHFYKPLQNDGRGSHELAFYTSFSSATRIPDHIRNIKDTRLALRKFVSSNPSTDSDIKPDCSFASTVYGGPAGILAQLLELKSWSEEQTIFHFYSCSVLMVYEKEEF
ncbi:PREDICTED: inositol, partial [Prunus dulcis]